MGGYFFCFKSFFEKNNKAGALSTKIQYNIFMNEYKTNNNVMYSCKYHVVWCPKYRRKVLVGDVAVRFKELCYEVCAQYKIDILEIEVMPDHVHLLLEVDPQFGINRAVKRIKGYTSHALREEFKSLTTKLPTLWTNSYFVSTVGGATLDVVKEYIQNQETAQPKIPKGKRTRYWSRKKIDAHTETKA